MTTNKELEPQNKIKDILDDHIQYQWDLDHNVSPQRGVGYEQTVEKLASLLKNQDIESRRDEWDFIGDDFEAAIYTASETFLGLRDERLKALEEDLK